MKKRTLFLMVFASIMTLYSCNRVLLALSGSHPPRLETDESIYKRGKELGIEADKVLAYKDSAFLKIKRFTSNSLYIYDKDGYYLKIQETSEDPKCGGSLLKALEGLGPITYFPRDSNKTIANEKSLWQNLQTKSPFSEISSNNHDYTVVYYWNIFRSLKKNQKDIEGIKNNIAKNKSVNFRLILVNQDLRRSDPTLAGIKL
jgi:hypothetical protein